MRSFSDGDGGTGMVSAATPPEDLPDGFSEPVLIGSGSGTKVYQVRDDVLGRLVALKLFGWPQAGDSRWRDRFLAECATATRLGAHPAVITVYSAGITPGGQPWLCMELAPHGSLAKALSDGPVQLPRALQLAAVIADALAWAHALDPPVLHRDVKPGNILLAEPDRPLLADFGISASIGRGRSSVTADEFTPLYAAPEVLQSRRFGPASEVWCLTATLFEMVVGVPPFPLREGEGVGEYIARVRAGLPEAAIPADVAAPVAALLREGLAVDRAARPATVADFAARIRRVQQLLGQPVSAPAAASAPATPPEPETPPEPAPNAGPAPDVGAPSGPAPEPGPGAAAPAPVGPPAAGTPAPSGEPAAASGGEAPPRSPASRSSASRRRLALVFGLAALACTVAVAVLFVLKPGRDGGASAAPPPPPGSPASGASAKASPPPPNATPPSGSSPGTAVPPGRGDIGPTGPPGQGGVLSTAPTSPTEPTVPGRGGGGDGDGVAFATTAVARWAWPSRPGFWNIDQRVKLETLGHHSFWAVDWTWPDGSTFGYLGLQTDGNRFDGSVGPMAILSVWGTRDAAGPACRQLPEAGGPYSCRLAFTVQTNRWYRLRLWRLPADAAGQWWGAWIMDESTGRDTFIGRVAVDPSRNLLGDAVSHTQYFGSATTCADVPRSVAVWTAPAGNSNGDAVGTYAVSARFANGDAPGCHGRVEPRTALSSPGAAINIGG